MPAELSDNSRHPRKTVYLSQPREVAPPAPLDAERMAKQVSLAERMLKARVRRTGIHEVRQPKLPHVAQPLERGRVEEGQVGAVHADVVPEGVAEGGQGAD